MFSDWLLAHLDTQEEVSQGVKDRSKHEEVIIQAVNETKDDNTVQPSLAQQFGALSWFIGYSRMVGKRLTKGIREGSSSQVFRPILHTKQLF